MKQNMWTIHYKWWFWYLLEIFSDANTYYWWL